MSEMMSMQERTEASEKLFKKYNARICPSNRSKNIAVSHIVKWSFTYSFPDLEMAVNNFQKLALQYDPKFRKSCANFFNIVGDAYFEDYLPNNFETDQQDMDSPMIPPLLTPERLKFLNS